MEKTARIFLTMKKRFAPIDLILLTPSVLVILHGFMR
jgi:hypothetical protein